MKRFFTFLAVALMSVTLTGCYDDSDLWGVLYYIPYFSMPQGLPYRP